MGGEEGSLVGVRFPAGSRVELGACRESASKTGESLRADVPDSAVINVNAHTKGRNASVDMAEPSHGEAREQDHREGAALEEAERGADRSRREGAVHFHPAAVVRIEGAEDAAKAVGGSQPTEDADRLHGGDFIKALLEVEFGPEEMEAPISSGSRVPKQATVEGSPVPHREASTELGVDPGVEPGREGAERDPHTEPPG